MKDFFRLGMAVLFVNNYIHFSVFIACAVTFYTVTHSRLQYQELYELQC